MPGAAEMSSPIRASGATNITLLVELPNVPVITSDTVSGGDIKTAGKIFADRDAKKSP